MASSLYERQRLAEEKRLAKEKVAKKAPKKATKKK